MAAGVAPGVQSLPQQQQQQQQRQQQQVRPVTMPPPPQQHHYQQQQQRQAVRAAEAVPAARRMIKKRKAPEQLLADKVKLSLYPYCKDSCVEGWKAALLHIYFQTLPSKTHKYFEFQKASTQSVDGRPLCKRLLYSVAGCQLCAAVSIVPAAGGSGEGGGRSAGSQARRGGCRAAALPNSSQEAARIPLHHSQQPARRGTGSSSSSSSSSNSSCHARSARQSGSHSSRWAQLHQTHGSRTSTQVHHTVPRHCSQVKLAAQRQRKKNVESLGRSQQQGKGAGRWAPGLGAPPARAAAGAVGRPAAEGRAAGAGALQPLPAQRQAGSVSPARLELELCPERVSVIEPRRCVGGDVRLAVPLQDRAGAGGAGPAAGGGAAVDRRPAHRAGAGGLRDQVGLRLVKML